MAGQQRLLIALAAFVVFSGSATAHDAAEGSNPAQEKPGKKFRGPNSPEFDNVRRALEALTPEQRKRFQDNFLRWANLPPEEKRALRDRDEVRRKRMTQEIDRAAREAGLQLEGERREQFAKRYTEERRKVEEQIRKEMEGKRQPRIREIIGKLKEEFSTPAPATPAVAGAAATPTPAPAPATAPALAPVQ